MNENDPRPLDVVQRWMQAVVMHPLGVEAGVQSDAAQEQISLAPNELAQVIEPSQALDSAERLGIYANAYYARLMECLADEFPVLAKLVGEEAFNDLAFGYLQAYPSRSYTLGRLGCDFAKYLAESHAREGMATDDWADLLVELARLEWTFNEGFDGPGAERLPRFDAETLRAIPPDRWPDVRLSVAPCLRLLELQFPVNQLYGDVRDERPFELPRREAAFLAVSRQEYVVRRYELKRPAYLLLSALFTGATVGEAISRVADDPATAPDTLASSLQRWFEAWTAAGFFVSAELTSG